MRSPRTGADLVDTRLDVRLQIIVGKTVLNAALPAVREPSLRLVLC